MYGTDELVREEVERVGFTKNRLEGEEFTNNRLEGEGELILPNGDRVRK